MKVHAALALVVVSSLFVPGCKKAQAPADPAPAAAPAVATVAAAPATLADPYQGWVAWNHPDGLFTVKFPKQYKLQDIKAGDPDSGTVPQAFAVALPNIYFAQGEAYHLKAGATFDPARAVSGGKDSMLASMQGRVLSEHAITLAGVDGVEVTYQGDAEGQPVWGTVRIYASKSPAAVYIINAMRVTAEDTPQAQAFLASLQIPSAGQAATTESD